MVYTSLLVEVIGFSLTLVFRKERGAVANGPWDEFDAVQATSPAVVADGLGCDPEAIFESLRRFQPSIAINLFKRGFGPRFDFSQNFVPAVTRRCEEIARGDTLSPRLQTRPACDRSGSVDGSAPGAICTIRMSESIGYTTMIGLSD